MLFIFIVARCVVLPYHEIEVMHCTAHCRLSLLLGCCYSVELAQIPLHRSPWSLQ